MFARRKNATSLMSHAVGKQRSAAATPGRSSVVVQSSQLCRFPQELFLNGMNHRYIFTSDALLLGSTSARSRAHTLGRANKHLVADFKNSEAFDNKM